MENKSGNEKKLYILLGLYVTALCASNLLGGKLMPIGFGDRGLSVSILMFPFLFLITDIVGEVFGKKKAKQFVNAGLISLLVLLAFQVFSLNVPGAVPVEWYETFNESYKTVFSLSISFTIASILAFFFGQYVDVFIYHTIKKRMGKRFIWLRNNVSTAIGQFIDSTIWVYIAFLPKILSGAFGAWELFSLIVIPYWLAKVIIAIIDTPLCYVGIRWLRS